MNKTSSCDHQRFHRSTSDLTGSLFFIPSLRVPVLFCAITWLLTICQLPPTAIQAASADEPAAGSDLVSSPLFSGLRRAWSVPLARGGELVHLEWDAADSTGSGLALPLHSHLRNKKDALQLDEQQARLLAEQGFSGLIIGCIAWYDALETIQEKSELGR